MSRIEKQLIGSKKEVIIEKETGLNYMIENN
jgi:hypothetical protein